MGQRLAKKFVLKAKDQNHAISHYREDESGIVVKFACNPEHLENILAKQDDDVMLICTGEKVLRDLSGYQAGFEILNTDAGDFSIIMRFQKPRKGVLNG